MTQYSEILKQNIDIDMAKQTVTTADGAVYTRYEMRQLKDQPPETILKIHRIKKHFRGEIL
jgi:hypothetical protein